MVCTRNTARAKPMPYSMPDVTVDEWKGYMRLWSSQKNPRWYGEPISLNSSRTMPPAVENKCSL